MEAGFQTGKLRFQVTTDSIGASPMTPVTRAPKAHAHLSFLRTQTHPRNPLSSSEGSMLSILRKFPVTPHRVKV